MTSFAKRSDSASHPLFVGIGRADIHLWLIKFDEISNCVADICLRLLSADERARLSRLLSRDHKEQYLIAHAGLRLLLSKYFPPIKPVNWAFSFGAFGRPEVTGGAPGLSFNISHTNGYVALAFARDCRLGVDVEARISEIDLELADSVCTPAELRDLRGVPSSLQTARFTRLWTLKEAYLKALGTGFALSAKAISYRFSPTGELMHAIKAPEAEKRNSWHFCYADVSNNCSLAIAWTSHQGPENRSVKQFRLCLRTCSCRHNETTRFDACRWGKPGQLLPCLCTMRASRTYCRIKIGPRPGQSMTARRHSTKNPSER